MTLGDVNTDKEASNIVFCDNIQSVCCSTVHMLSLMLFDLCMDFSLSCQDQGITFHTKISLEGGQGQPSWGVTAHLPPISLGVKHLHAAALGQGSMPLEEDQRLMMLSSCLFWMFISKVRLIQNPFRSFFFDVT